ncbi:MAG: hypothetical protein GY856_31655 [bacterium]|nr:hypothetical protein [bacterium]
MPGEHPVGDWELLIDARTGEIFKAVDNAYYVDGNGNIFEPDPLSPAQATYGDPGFEDGGDADTPELTGELVNRVLRDITLNGGGQLARGPTAILTAAGEP